MSTNEDRVTSQISFAHMDFMEETGRIWDETPVQDSHVLVARAVALTGPHPATMFELAESSWRKLPASMRYALAAIRSYDVEDESAFAPGEQPR